MRWVRAGPEVAGLGGHGFAGDSELGPLPLFREPEAVHLLLGPNGDPMIPSDQFP